MAMLRVYIEEERIKKKGKTSDKLAGERFETILHLLDGIHNELIKFNSRHDGEGKNY
jgi:hypothetical protein